MCCASAQGVLTGEHAGMHPVLLALLGTSFGWFMTALGSAAVIIHRFGIKEKTYPARSSTSCSACRVA